MIVRSLKSDIQFNLKFEENIKFSPVGFIATDFWSEYKVYCESSQNTVTEYANTLIVSIQTFLESFMAICEDRIAIHKLQIDLAEKYNKIQKSKIEKLNLET